MNNAAAPYMHRRHRSAMLCVLALATVALIAPSGAQQLPEPLRGMPPSVQALRAQVAAAHPDSPSLAAVDGRVGQLSARALALRASLRQSMTSAMAAAIGGVSGLDEGAFPASVQPVLNPVVVYQALRSELGGWPACPELPEPARSDLLAYYRAAVYTTTSWLAVEARTAVISDAESWRTCCELCLAMCFAAIPDGEWHVGDVTRLPNWLARDALLAYFEEGLGLDDNAGNDDAQHFQDFALSLNRPKTAYSFAILNGTGDDYPAYLASTSQRLRSQRHQREAAICMQAGVEEQRRAGNRAEAARLLLDLARMMAQCHSFEQGEAKARELLADYGDLPTAAEAARLYVRCLFGQGKFPETVAAAGRLRADERLGAVRPHLIYAQWLSSLRMREEKQAATFQQQFLDAYSTHALASEMHYVLGCQALARGELAEAERQMAVIETEFPQSRVALPVARIRERLESERSGSAHPGRTDAAD